MIYAYIRVSTDKQTVENQRFEIENYCRKRQIDVDQYIEETISGMKDVDKRKLGTLLKKMRKDDTLIASEISRLGRRLLEVMSILDNLMKKKIRVITVKEGFELCDNLQSHVIAFAFSLASEIERSLISQRTKEALARKKSLGMKLGRKTGGTNSRHKLDKHKELIRTMVEYGYSKAAICRKVKCQYSTLDKHLEREGLIVRNYTPRPRKPKDITTEKKTVPQRRKKRKVIIKKRIQTDRAPHVEYQAAAYQYRHQLMEADTLREKGIVVDVDKPAILQEKKEKLKSIRHHHHLLFPHEKEILKFLRQGKSKVFISRYFNCNIKTLDAHLKRMGVEVVYR